MKLKSILTVLFTGLFFLYFMIGNSLANELTPYEIIKKVDDRDDGDTSISNMIMVKVSKNGQQRILEIKSFRKDYGKDSKSILFFTAPADKKNVSFLSWDKDNEAEEDDKWLYLPAGNIKTRISGGKKKDSFMGSDFSYADMESLDIDNWDYSFITHYKNLTKSNLDPKVDGEECWIISATPKPEKVKKIDKEIGYKKRIIWVRKDNFMAVRGITELRKGRKIKMFFARKLKQVQGIWTAHELEMQTYRGKISSKKNRSRSLQHRTILLFKDMKYNEPIDDSTFSVQRMIRGL